MKRKRSIIIFWALFLVPALLMAGTGFVLLKNEQERLRLSSVHALSQRAKAVGETIHLTVEAIQENFETSLLEIDPARIESTLKQWETVNPLVRNIFVYQPGEDLLYPVQGPASTSEERRFMARYDSLFKGRMNFDAGRAGHRDEPSQKTSAGESNTVSYLSLSRDDLSEKNQSSRKQLVALSRMAKSVPQAESILLSGDDTTAEFIGKKGWIPWFSENRLFILGWVQPYDNQAIYGVELELMTLLSQLVVDFPKLTRPEASLALVDGNGKIMHQTGSRRIDDHQRPVVSLPVSRLLPHWQVAVFMGPDGLPGSRGFLYISVLLLAVFIAAIVSGGILLTRLTLSNIRDARLKTSFVSSVSHELKTPLTSIRMYAELLHGGRIKDPDKTGNYLSIIVDESQRLTRLINNVLDFSRLEQKRKQYRPVPVDLAGLLSRITDAHAIRTRDNGLEVQTRTAPGNYTIRTDPDAVEQVILNLLDNAVKYAHTGTYIQFHLANPETGLVRLKICDNGPGIPETHQDQIFSTFHRIDNSLTAGQSGYGLGLSIARQIARDLGGDLVIDGSQDRGACFIFTLKDMETIR